MQMIRKFILYAWTAIAAFFLLALPAIGMILVCDLAGRQHYNLQKENNELREKLNERDAHDRPTD